MKKQIAAVLFVTCSWLGNTEASELINVIGTGNASCGKWLANREIKNHAQIDLYHQWIAGFLVSYNYYAPDSKSKKAVNPQDFESFAAYMDKFCRDNPLSLIIAGAAQLVQDSGGSTAFHNRQRR